MDQSSKEVPSTQLSSKTRIDQYEIIKLLGKGGMGEVYLALDTTYGREIALKKVRDDLLKHPIIKERFLKEAKIASRLAHPSIIPIYDIKIHDAILYYTMPYVEGNTLKEILNRTKDQEKTGENPDPIGSSIPHLIRIFYNVCQAIAYSHSKGYVHRDLKPDNIMVGKYGEVLILDWGIADIIGSQSASLEEEINEAEFKRVTLPGKVVGTLSYMAPERVKASPVTVSWDVYSLGVMLFQILTLRLPFKRKNLKYFVQHMHLEKLPDPTEVAPYRDISPQLVTIVKKCLEINPNDRFQTVDEIIDHLESYIEGRPEWMVHEKLDIDRKEDWQFHENVLLTKHIAITKTPEFMEWVSLQISRCSLSTKIKVETEVRIHEGGAGIGLLVNVPEPEERQDLADGYCIWFSADKDIPSKIFRSNVEVMQIPSLTLKYGQWHHISIESLENGIRVFVDYEIKGTYVSHLPLTGRRIGLLYKDADFEIKAIKPYYTGHPINVNCLAIADALLANKNYLSALSEYRRIGSTFPGRAEGREALFRAGITLIELSKIEKHRKKKQFLLASALEEFESLRLTPGAPLEYLGKSLVYKTNHDLEEEIKCLELVLRKYPKHPLTKTIKEIVILRSYEATHQSKTTAFHFSLLILRHLSHDLTQDEYALLLKSLKSSLTPPYFLKSFQPQTEQGESIHLMSLLAYWLAKPVSLVEILEMKDLEEPDKTPLIENALFALLNLGFIEWVDEMIPSLNLEASTLELIQLCSLAIKGSTHLKAKTGNLLLDKPWNNQTERAFLLVLELLLQNKKYSTILKLLEKAEGHPGILLENLENITITKLRCLIMLGDYKSCESIFLNSSLIDAKERMATFKLLYIAYLFGSGKQDEAQRLVAKTYEFNTSDKKGLLYSYLIEGSSALPTIEHEDLSYEDKIFTLRNLIAIESSRMNTEVVKKLERSLHKEINSIRKKYLLPPL